jgi:predicted dehydrogenase
LEIDVEDVASTLMEYEADGKTIPVHLQQDYVRRPPSRACQIIGDDGRIEIDLRAGTVEVFGASGELAEAHASAVQRDQLFLDEARHFLACLRREDSPVVTVRDGAQSLRMALAAKRSMESGQVVELS